MPSPSTYRIYGVSVATAYPWTHHVLPTSAPPDLSFDCTTEEPDPSFWPHAHCVHTEHSDDMQTRVYRHESAPAYWAVRFGTIADYYLRPDRIVCHLRDEAGRHAVEGWLLGPMFALWLEQCGQPALHTAAVVANGRGVGFLATNKGGKSSLAAALMQAGCPLLTDDILTVEATERGVWGHPSYPQMRMWPDQARHFLGSAEDLPLVVPHLSKRRVPVGPDGLGTFHDTAVPITHLLLPERRPDVDSVQVQPLAPQRALVELVRHSFLANTISKLGRSRQRLPVLATLVRQARVARLVYPEGVDHLPQVAAVLLRSVEGKDPIEA